MTPMQDFFRPTVSFDEKLVKITAALSKRDDDVASLKSDLNLIKWMVGFILAFQMALFAKLFFH